MAHFNAQWTIILKSKKWAHAHAFRSSSPTASLAKHRQAIAWVWGHVSWKDYWSQTFAVIGNILSHFDSSDQGKCLIKPTICNFWLSTFSFLCCHEWSGNFCREDNFHHLPPSLSTGAPHRQNHRAVQLPGQLKAEKPQELRQTSFSLKYRSPPLACLRWITHDPIRMPQIFVKFCYLPKMWKEEVN